MASRSKQLESKYQSDLIKKLREIVEPHGYVLCQDGNYIQGFPDILVLYKTRWAALECKRSHSDPYKPNQEYYLADLDSLSFASVIYPEIEEEVLNELHEALRIRRRTRVSKS